MTEERYFPSIDLPRPSKFDKQSPLFRRGIYPRGVKFFAKRSVWCNDRTLLDRICQVFHADGQGVHTS